MTEQMGPTQFSWERERMLEALDAYRRGLCEPPIIRKWTAAPGAGEAPANIPGEYEKSGGSDGLPDATAMTFVISTDEVDRHGDIIATRGWQLDSYKNNPVFLWAHDYARPVIGKATDVWAEPHSLMARMEFAPTNFAREIASLYKAGYQRGVSVGFKPLRFEERRHEKTGALLGLRFLEQELLETSAVPVPANRSALRRALAQAPISRDYLQRNCAGLGDAIHLQNDGRQDDEAGASSLQLVWPELSARLDDLEKLAGELAEMSRQVARHGADDAGQAGGSATLMQLLEALRWEPNG